MTTFPRFVRWRHIGISQFQFQIKIIQFYGDFVVQITLSRVGHRINVQRHKSHRHNRSRCGAPIFFSFLFPFLRCSSLRLASSLCSQIRRHNATHISRNLWEYYALSLNLMTTFSLITHNFYTLRVLSCTLSPTPPPPFFGYSAGFAAFCFSSRWNVGCSGIYSNFRSFVHN